MWELFRNHVHFQAEQRFRQHCVYFLECRLYINSWNHVWELLGLLPKVSDLWMFHRSSITWSAKHKTERITHSVFHTRFGKKNRAPHPIFSIPARIFWKIQIYPQKGEFATFSRFNALIGVFTSSRGMRSHTSAFATLRIRKNALKITTFWHLHNHAKCRSLHLLNKNGGDKPYHLTRSVRGRNFRFRVSLHT